MSNKRRKRIGSTKIARNLAIRIRRGAERAGNPLPGSGRNTVTANAEALRAAVAVHTSPHWGDARR